MLLGNNEVVSDCLGDLDCVTRWLPDQFGLGSHAVQTAKPVPSRQLSHLTA